MKSIFFLFILVSLLFSGTQIAWAEPILITISDGMDKVIFDGKWTFPIEWKKSSLNKFVYDEKTIFFRSAHQDNNIYFFIDFVSDEKINFGKDKSMICLNPKNNTQFLENSYCFISILGEKQPSEILIDFKPQKISQFLENYENLVVMSDKSDENDRHSKTPHASYEFRIPTEIVGRFSEYGIYISVYDADSKSLYTYPQNLEINSFDEIPETIQWGQLISPDKSLPEFHLIYFVIVISIFSVVFLTRIKQFNYCKIN